MIKGFASKLIGDLAKTGQVSYSLPIGEHLLALNDYLGKVIKLNFTGIMQCVGCGRDIKKTYQQGYCFFCTQTLAACDLCILKPELCHYAQGTCREPEWGEAHCLQPHYVYLANTSELKVGITRAKNIPSRWIDQGASQALPILLVKSRYLAGLVEVAIAKHVKDKTNWRKMLQGVPIALDLFNKREEFIGKIADWLHELKTQLPEDSIISSQDSGIYELHFPVLSYPEKLISLNFEKTPEIEGVLLGIKGQYLLLDQGVLNMRNATGFELVWQ